MTCPDFALLACRKHAEDLRQQRTNPSSKFQVTVNATDLFERYLYEEEYDEFGEKIVKERKNSQKQKSGRNGAGARRGMTSGGLLVIPVLALVASVV